MKRTIVVVLLCLMAGFALWGAGCTSPREGPEGSQPQLRQPQWRPAWVRDGRWDPHWVENEPYRPWPL